MKNLTFYLTLVTTIVLSSCMSSGKMVEQLNRSNEEMLISQPLISDTLVARNVIYLEEIEVPDYIAKEPKVVKTEVWAVPLVLLNFWTNNRDCIIGENMFSTTYKNSIAEVLIEKSKSSKATLLDSTINSKYKLQVKLIKNNAKASLNKDGFFLIMLAIPFTHRSTKIESIEADIQLKATLYKENNIAFIKFYNYSNFNEKPEKPIFGSDIIKVGTVLTSEVKLGIDSLAKQIIDDLDTYIVKNENGK